MSPHQLRFLVPARRRLELQQLRVLLARKVLHHRLPTRSVLLVPIFLTPRYPSLCPHSLVRILAAFLLLTPGSHTSQGSSDTEKKSHFHHHHRHLKDLIHHEGGGEITDSSDPTSGASTPTKAKPSHLGTLRSFILSVMAFEKGRKFSAGASAHRKRQMSTLVEKEGQFGPSLTVCA